MSSIPQILDGLETAIDALVELAASAQPEELRHGAEGVLSWLRSLKQELPPAVKKGPFQKLPQHMRFVELYLNRKDMKMVRGNIRSLRPEMVKLRSLCGGALPNLTA